jgi:Lysophospholipase L1 and related esterases
MRTKYIFFLGDSLTYGYLVPSNRSFPSVIEKKLREKKLIEKDVRIINAGNPGDTTEMALFRLKYYLSQYKNIFIAVIYLGANDYLMGASVNQVHKNLTEIIQQLKNYNKNIKIILISFMPFDPSLEKEYQKMYDQIKNQYPEILIITDVLQEILREPSLVMSDGIHPNEKGYEIIANKVLPYIEGLLK